MMTLMRVETTGTTTTEDAAADPLFDAGAQRGYRRNVAQPPVLRYPEPADEHHRGAETQKFGKEADPRVLEFQADFVHPRRRLEKDLPRDGVGSQFENVPAQARPPTRKIKRVNPDGRFRCRVDPEAVSRRVQPQGFDRRLSLKDLGALLKVGRGLFFHPDRKVVVTGG